jgi:4-amino-4-deoxy-L-arabinose transferase-like glycosyltransferase
VQLTLQLAALTTVLLLVLACGIALFIWRLGSTGLVDETPPLFAAAARAMAQRQGISSSQVPTGRSARDRRR